MIWLWCCSWFLPLTCFTERPAVYYILIWFSGFVHFTIGVHRFIRVAEGWSCCLSFFCQCFSIWNPKKSIILEYFLAKVEDLVEVVDFSSDGKITDSCITKGVFFLYILYPMITRRVMCTKKARWAISQKLLNITQLQISGTARNASQYNTRNLIAPAHVLNSRVCA